MTANKKRKRKTKAHASESEAARRARGIKLVGVRLSEGERAWLKARYGGGGTDSGRLHSVLKDAMASDDGK